MAPPDKNMQPLFRYLAPWFALLPVLFFPVCRGISGPYTYRLVLPSDSDFSITAGEIEEAMKEGLTPFEAADPYLAEITVYGYSSVKEVFSFSGSEEEGVSVKQGKGHIEAMVRVKKGGKTLRLFFVRGEGNSRGEILEGLLGEMRKVLNLPGKSSP